MSIYKAKRGHDLLLVQQFSKINKMADLIETSLNLYQLLIAKYCFFCCRQYRYRSCKVSTKAAVPKFRTQPFNTKSITNEFQTSFSCFIPYFTDHVNYKLNDVKLYMTGVPCKRNFCIKLSWILQKRMNIQGITLKQSRLTKRDKYLLNSLFSSWEQMFI